MITALHLSGHLSELALTKIPLSSDPASPAAGAAFAVILRKTKQLLLLVLQNHGVPAPPLLSSQLWLHRVLIARISCTGTSVPGT